MSCNGSFSLSSSKSSIAAAAVATAAVVIVGELMHQPDWKIYLSILSAVFFAATVAEIWAEISSYYLDSSVTVSATGKTSFGKKYSQH